MESHEESLRLQSCSLISHPRPLCAPSHDHQTKLRPSRPSNQGLSPWDKPELSPFPAGPGSDPARQSRFHSQLFCSFQRLLGVQEPENQMAPAPRSWGPPSQRWLPLASRLCFSSPRTVSRGFTMAPAPAWLMCGVSEVNFLRPALLSCPALWWT